MDGAIIRPYVDLNLETLFNVRTMVDWAFSLPIAVYIISFPSPSI